MGDYAKGEIRKTYEAWCGICSDWVHLQRSTYAGAEKTARQLGWKKTTAHGWVCPACLERRDEETEAGALAE